MGNSQSISTHGELYDATKDSTILINKIFEYMMQKISVNDLMALSNPAQCQKYVIFKANALHSYFHELNIMPVKDKKDIIAFRKIEELTKPQDSADKLESQKLCLSIAYFYTRIFQIYGALALTLIDDMKTATDSGFTGVIYDRDKRKLPLPGQAVHMIGGTFGTTFGGAIPPLLRFNFIRSYLIDEKGSIPHSTFGWETRYKRYISEFESENEKENNTATIYFKRLSKTIENKKERVPGDDDGKDTGIFSIGYPKSKYTIKLIITTTKIDQKITVDFGKLYYHKDNKDISIITDILPKRLNIIEILSTPRSYKIKSSDVEISELTIADYFNGLFLKLIPFLKSYFKDSTSVYTSDMDELKLTRTVDALRKRPYGHCIARALQLLRSEPFKDKPGDTSSICISKFLTTSSTTSRSGIPQPGAKLDTSPGLSALAQLFYDTIGQSSLVINTQKDATGKSTYDKYIEFMTKMAYRFGDKTVDGHIRTSDSYKSGLSTISNKKDKYICKGPLKEYDDKEIKLPSDTRNKVYTYVKNLFRIQYNHAKKCGHIFNQLFYIKRDKSYYNIGININVLKKGIHEVERINNEARQILVDYYSNCEIEYTKGVYAIIDDKKIVKP
jgi:hypothetical protein